MVENNQLFAQGALAAPGEIDLGFVSEISLGHHIVLGSPGSGKTSALRKLVAELEKTSEPEGILVLTPSRQSATKLRDLLALESRKPTSSPRAQSVTGYAFSRLVLENPDIRLLSGAMQQAILRDLIEQSPNAPWGFDLQTISLQGFIQELRDLIAVCIENSLNSAWLNQRAQEFSHRGLAIAAELLPLYESELARAGLVDPSQLILEAAKLPAALAPNSS